MRQLGLSAVLVVIAAGCVPYPHRYQYLPGVEGRVAEASVPLAAAQVALRFQGIGAADPCDAPAEAQSITDAQGMFTIPGERRVDLFISMGHSFESWGFCFTRRDGSTVSWASPSRYRAGPRYGPVRMTLDCDLGRRAADVCWIRAYEYGKW